MFCLSLISWFKKSNGDEHVLDAALTSLMLSSENKQNSNNETTLLDLENIQTSSNLSDIPDNSNKNTSTNSYPPASILASVQQKSAHLKTWPTLNYRKIS